MLHIPLPRGSRSETRLAARALTGRGLATLVGLAVLVGPGSLASMAQDFSQVEIRTEKVAANVYMLEGLGGNIGVSTGKDGVFLVDDQFAPLTEKIKKAVAAISEQPIRFVLNTHWHFDHTGGNENFGNAGTLIVAHDNVRERMSTDQFIEALDMQVPASPKAALPVVTYAEGVNFHINGDTLVAFHVPPAHTDGDSAVYWQQANVLHTGDLFFNGAFPFVDLSSGGSFRGLIAAIETLLSKIDDDTKIIPGHGPLAAKADLQGYHDTLVAIDGAMAPLVSAGKSLQEVLDINPLKPWSESLGGGFVATEAFTETVYASLSAEIR